jgi:superfamily II DNA or RNA helicase
MIEIPFDVVGELRKSRLAAELTVTPRKQSVTYGAKEMDEDGKVIVVDPTPIIQFTVDMNSRTVKVPWSWGMGLLAETPTDRFECHDIRSAGKPWKPARFPDPNHPKATPGQGKFFDDVLAATREKSSVLIEAPTGGGKTVTMLNTIGRIGKTALVIVPSKSLADQWLLEAMRHLGLEREEVSIMQGSALEWDGKKLVIAVIHNLFLKEFPEAFYQYFGTVCWDEAHRLGAPEFSKTMRLFGATYRIAATATPDRKDGCMDLVTNHFGKVAVSMEAEALEAECRVIRFMDPFASKIARLPPPTILTILVKNKTRNLMIVDTVKVAWKRGRCILVLSDRIEHLQTMQKMAIAAGIPEAQNALYVGSYMANGKKKTVGQGYLRTVREDPKFKVIWATYSMMKEGTDIPRLDCGVDATPRADGKQAIGRIRRPLPGKPTPVWFTIVDTQIPIFVSYSISRIRDYSSSNVTIIDDLT